MRVDGAGHRVWGDLSSLPPCFALLAIFKKVTELSSGAIKQATKPPRLDNTCRGNPGLKLRGKHGRFVTVPRSLKGPVTNNKSNQQPCPPSPVPSPAFPTPLATTDQKRTKAGPAASASSLFLPDLRRAELDQLVDQMGQHFPGVSEMTSEQLKAIEGYFNCSDPCRRLDGFRFQMYRDFSYIPAMQCSLDGFLAHWPPFWQRTQIADRPAPPPR